MVSKFLFLAVTAALIPLGSIDATADSRRMTVLRPPVTPACISSSFGPRILPNQPEAGTYHYGVDLPAAEGAAVFAAAPGTVMRIQSKGPGGLEMLVQHDSFVGIYSHFGMILPAFTEGKRTVAAGEKLGVVGRTGVTSGAHLYFEMLLAGKPVDPAPYLGVPPCSGGVGGVPVRTAGGIAVTGQLPRTPGWQIDLPAQQYIQWHQN
jgi:murein DD-endopeptidase MepM/ murein hydrolase activator NlpD